MSKYFVYDIEKDTRGADGCGVLSIKNGREVDNFEDMSGYQWHDTEKEKPEHNREVLVQYAGRRGLASTIGWYDKALDLWNWDVCGSYTPIRWATLYIPPLPSANKQETKEKTL